MDLTAPIGIAALLVAVGTVLLVVRELMRIIWFTLPVWFRLLLGLGMVAIAVVFLSHLR